MNLLTMHEVVQAENEVLKKQMKLHLATNEERKKELKMEIIKLNAKVLDKRAKLKERR